MSIGAGNGRRMAEYSEYSPKFAYHLQVRFIDATFNVD